MSTRLSRDVRSMRHRIRMGRPRLWVIVEGRDYDRGFYETVLGSLGYEDVEIRLAEEIEVDGVTAGGKRHALAVHQHFERDGALKQANSAGTSSIVVMLDKDDDDYLGATVASPHVIYTQHCDVEAEILAYGGAVAATGLALGLPRGAVSPVAVAHPNPLSDLAELWLDWIRLRLIGQRCGAPGCARFASQSTINLPAWGGVDQQRLSDLLQTLERTSTGPIREHIEEVDAYIAGLHSADKLDILVKGKWMAGYLLHLVKSELPRQVTRANVTDHAIVSSCLAGLGAGTWTDHYRDAMARMEAA